MDDPSRPYQILPWDSENFGLVVARLPEALADAALRTALHEARVAGVELVYWAATHRRPVSPQLLADFAGHLVDRKVTFARRLDDAGTFTVPAGVQLTEAPRGPASVRLMELARASGHTSRYYVDPRFPRDRCRLLYETWIERSTRREIADQVLAVTTEGDSEPAGMITLSLRDAAGGIGLIAVLPEHRGKGFASVLMRAGHHWLCTHGTSRVTVVTQLDNAAACRLYRRFDYTIETVHDFYHFWPNAGLVATSTPTPPHGSRSHSATTRGPVAPHPSRK
jgi:ribosomal protein S18 acetylase RimI-like enzyme